MNNREIRKRYLSQMQKYIPAKWLKNRSPKNNSLQAKISFIHSFNQLFQRAFETAPTSLKMLFV